MNAVERVKKICKERKLPVSKLERDCGFANGYIGQLRKGTFPNDRLSIVAEYLNVTAEYLSSGVETKFSPEMAMIDVELSNMSLEMKEYALKLARLPFDKQKQIMSLIDMLG